METCFYKNEGDVEYIVYSLGDRAQEHPVIFEVLNANNNYYLNQTKTKGTKTIIMERKNSQPDEQIGSVYREGEQTKVRIKAGTFLNLLLNGYIMQQKTKQLKTK